MNISRASAEELLDLLSELEDYFEGKVDVVDGDYGTPEPNKEMRLCSRIKEAANYLMRKLAVHDDPS